MVVGMDADAGLPGESVGDPIPREHKAGLAAADHERWRASAVHQNGRELEVVVAYVVGSDLVEPAQRSGVSVGDDLRVGVERGAPEGAPVRALPRPAVRVGIGSTPIDETACDARRVPRAAPSGLALERPVPLDGREPPTDLSGRGVEGVEEPLAAWW